MHRNICIDIYYRYVCVFHAYTYILHLSVCVRISRRYVCVHQCAMVMDRLCAHALAGSCCGLDRNPETLSRASPCPSAWTAWRLRRAGVLLGVGVQRQHRRVEHRISHLVVRGMRHLFGPGGAPPPAGCARPVVDAVRAVVLRGPPMRARACVRERVGRRMRGRPRV
jgi:hypothetical protein